MGGKEKRISDTQLGKVNFCLCLVNDLTTESGVHFIPGDTLILHIGAIIDEKTVSFTGNGFQQGGTPTVADC
jgi:hypothetical protein